jgi:hypothetical protein
VWMPSPPVILDLIRIFMITTESAWGSRTTDS